MEKERTGGRPIKRSRKKVCMFCVDRAEKMIGMFCYLWQSFSIYLKSHIFH